MFSHDTPIPYWAYHLSGNSCSCRRNLSQERPCMHTNISLTKHLVNVGVFCRPSEEQCYETINQTFFNTILVGILWLISLKMLFPIRLRLTQVPRFDRTKASSLGSNLDHWCRSRTLYLTLPLSL